MRASHDTGADQIANCVLHFNFERKIDRWDWADFEIVANFQIARTTEAVAAIGDRGAGITDAGYSRCESADEDDLIAAFLKPLSGDVLLFGDQTDHADSGRGIDYSPGTLII